MLRRRLLAAATAGALALAALTGCRSDPSVAAYVDGVKITESQVDRVVDNARQAVDRDAAAARSQGEQALPEQVPSRADIVGVLVTQRLTERALAQRGLSAEPVDASQIAQVFGVPAGSTYASALASVISGTSALGQAVGASYQPTDAELRSVYDAAVAAGVLPAGAFDQARPELLQVQGLPQALAARDELAKAAPSEHITVNPRYLPLSYPVQWLSTQQGKFKAVLLPLADRNHPVTDVSPAASDGSAR